MHISPLHDSIPQRQPSLVRRVLAAPLRLFRSAPRTAAVRPTDGSLQGCAARTHVRPAPSAAEGLPGAPAPLERCDYDGSDLHSLHIWYPARDKVSAAPLVRVGPGGDYTRDNPRGDGAARIVLYLATAALLWFWLLPLLMGTGPIVKTL